MVAPARKAAVGHPAGQWPIIDQLATGHVHRHPDYDASGGTARHRGGGGLCTGARLEYLLIPLTFGLSAPLVAMVGANVGAGQQPRPRRIAYTGTAIAFILSETIGLAAAIWPHA